MGLARTSGAGLAGVGDEHDGSSQEESKFVFVCLPKALT
jgi:hypothetical protein